METAKALHAYRAPPARRAAPVPQGARQSAAAVHLGAPRAVLNLGSNTPQQIEQIAGRQAGENLKAALGPLQNQGKEVQANEAGASQRYQGYAGAANTLLGGFAAQQQASAKTAENAAADNALQAGKAIETTGQQQASMTAGFMTPELKAELAAEGNRTSAAGAAGNTFAANTGQSGENLLSGIRGAAALRAVEGQGKITDFFQKQQQQIQAKEGELAGKQGAEKGRIENELAQKNLTDYATLQSLGIKGQALVQKGTETKEKIRTTERGQNFGRANNQENNATRIKQGEENNRVKERGQNFSRASAQEKAAIAKEHNVIYAQIHKETANGTKPNPTAGRKMMSLVDGAAGYAAMKLKSGASQATVRKELSVGEGTGKGGEEGQGYTPDVIHAAMNLAVYGVLGPEDRAVMTKYGLTNKIRPEWFKPHK
jgi:hypothetical protein